MSVTVAATGLAPRSRLADMAHGQEDTLQVFGDEIIPELAGARV